MEFETEGGVLDIHFGNKTDVDIWWKRTHLVTVKKTVWSYLAAYLLGYNRLYEHHAYGCNGHPLQLWLKKRPDQPF
jgi:hypothetical protein